VDLLFGAGGSLPVTKKTFEKFADEIIVGSKTPTKEQYLEMISGTSLDPSEVRGDSKVETQTGTAMTIIFRGKSYGSELHS
jgi:hypothetical protein